MSWHLSTPSMVCSPRCVAAVRGLAGPRDALAPASLSPPVPGTLPSREQDGPLSLPARLGLYAMLTALVVARQVAAFEPVPKFQPAQRDIAVIVADTVSHDELMEAVYSAATGGLLRDAMLFDVYKPKQASPALGIHEKSLAVRLTLASGEATLTDEQIDMAVKAVVDRIASRLGGRLRG